MPFTRNSRIVSKHQCFVAISTSFAKQFLNVELRNQLYKGEAQLHQATGLQQVAHTSFKGVFANARVGDRRCSFQQMKNERSFARCSSNFLLDLNE
mgnify:CR=1 FL=1